MDPTILMLLVAAGSSVVLAIAHNPHEKGTDAHTAVRLCRVGLCLAVWGFSFGLVGIGLGLAGVALGVVGIVKGQTAYGIAVVFASLILPVVGMYFNLIPILRVFRAASL